MNFKILLPISLFLLLLVACTPKTTEPAKTDEPEPVTETPTEPEEELSPCKNWHDLPNKDEVIEWHVLYRDQMKFKNYKAAFPMWQKAYDAAPAADGKRNTHFADGIQLYQAFWREETDSLKKDEYVKNILRLYDEVMDCYGDEGYITGRKAFDLYYNYQGYASDLEMYNMFKKSLDMEGDSTQAFLYNPFTALLSNLVIAEEITVEEASKYAGTILEYLEINKERKTQEEWKKEGWDIVYEYVPARLENMEGIKGFFDCEYYKEKYYSAYETAPDSCDPIITVLGRLKWGDCPADDPQLMAVLAAFDENCKKDTVLLCRNFLSEGDYSQAVKCYEEKAVDSDDSERKAQFYLIIAKIYYGELKQYSTARRYAQKALEAKPGWGEPHILIGKLYASSGPLCGPGRGWDSQIVTWPAIDEWNQAKSDPETRSEAIRLINRYSQYMPNKEDVFIRSLKVGDKYRVPCWIQRTTTIRTSD